MYILISPVSQRNEQKRTLKGGFHNKTISAIRILPEKKMEGK
jgi:hypothetical protein